MFEETVLELLSDPDIGSTLTLTRRAGQTYNPATGTVSAGTTSTFSILGVFINYQDDRIDGTVIRVGDRMLLVSATGSDTTPAIGDSVGGLEIVNVRTFAPAGTAVAWACQTRK